MRAKTTEEASASSPYASVIRAFKHRNYQLFFSGQLISLIGTWMQVVAQSWLVYRLTGSPVLLGAVGFAAQFPIFLIAPFGGHVSDRRNLRHMIITTQTAAMLLAAILAVLTLTNTVQVWHVFVLAVLLGVVNGFDVPARQAFVVEMVGREDLMNAIALNSSMGSGGRTLGPAIAGILVAKIGEGWCFALNAASYIAVIAGLLLMHVPTVARSIASSPLQNMIEGFRFVAKTRPILALLLLLGMASVLGMPYTVLMPIFADRILHGGARGLGILMGTSGVGAIVAALFLAGRRGAKMLPTWIAVSATGFGLSLILFSGSRWFWLSTLLLLPVGGCMQLQLSSINTMVQLMVPDQLRGRVMGLYAMMFMGMTPIGALFAGTVASRLGAPRTVGFSGLACVAGSLLFAALLPTMRTEMRELVLSLGIPNSEMQSRSATEADAPSV